MSIPEGIIFEIINHSFFQRLRRIKQLGLTNLVYPGANHTRFQHTLGAVHLMQKALNTLQKKGVAISEEEYNAACLGILLHDIGHGPFSHALEYHIVEQAHHEDISVMVMNYFNSKYKGALDLTLQMYLDHYPRKFFHQLMSSQLDVDRLDYLNRDSFFTGVAEGVVGVERMISILNVSDNEIVFQRKGIYTIENFLLARRLMYWQVYLHKNVIISENTVLQILLRAKAVVREGKSIFLTSNMRKFIAEKVDLSRLKSDPHALESFMRLDDLEFITCMKEWMLEEDSVLKFLSRSILERKLLTIELSPRPFKEDYIQEIRTKVEEKFGFTVKELDYLVFTGISQNRVYSQYDENIKILTSSGAVIDVLEASDQFNSSILSRPVKKYYICYPRLS